MFYDCTERRIQDGDEFAVAIGGKQYHGFMIDAVEVDDSNLHLKPGQEVMYIECCCIYEKKTDNFLRLKRYVSRKNEKKILPDVFIFRRSGEKETL